MSILSELQTLVLLGLARDDATAVTIAKAAINYAMVMAALIFEPPELRGDADFNIPSASSKVSLSTLTNWLDIISIRNKTDGHQVRFIPFELWETIIPTTTLTKYYSLFGNYIYVKGIPSTTRTFTISYTTYPAKLTEPTDPVPFEQHDSYIVSVALGLAFAFFEEGETAGMWQKASEVVMLPLTLGLRARQVVEQQKTLFEASTQGSVKQ